MSAEPIIALEEFVNLDTEQQVENLKRWKADYTLKDIREVWGFKHSAQYYMLLKKLRIYEQVVNKSDKFHPEQMMQRAQQQEAPRGYVREDHFDYQLNTTLSGPELAERLERAAQFLRGEDKPVSVRLYLATLEVAKEEASEASETSEAEAEEA
ncbi:hypothetical protein IDH44_06865 [Paenibacillus sp. IB182496]|uniref:Uncharacterized protein n=1 Tax=Paenibacillus sabuli TaxID=2772509 RepID=A0A927GQU7_9BACL|nr:hypothetical protein [Paenibacillus sabuli]MBD2844904.1 hypothetical protein [Paenibacillus sabuli]